MVPRDALPFLLEIAVETVHARDRPALLGALASLVDADEHVGFTHDSVSRQVIIHGCDEAGLDGAIIALRERHGLELRTGALQIAYRETLARRVETDTTHKRRDEHGAEFARVIILFEPSDGSSFVSRLGETAIPPDLVAGLKRGLEAARRAGALAGFPVVDVRATLLDGAWHATDSSPAAFEAAALTAFRNAQREGGLLLEPIMQVEITAPQGDVDAVRRDLILRRGEVGRARPRRGDVLALAGTVPLANLLGYPASLNAMTRSHGTLTMRFSHYAPILPPDPPRFPPVAALAG